MTSLARKVMLLVAPAAVGCAQVPAPTSYADALPDARGLVAPGGPLGPVRQAGNQEPAGKDSVGLPPPRPVDPKQPDPAPAMQLAGPPTLANLEELADRVNPIIVRDRAQVEYQRGQAVQAGIWSNPQFNSNNPEIFAGRNTALNAGFQLEIPVNGKKVLDQAAANEATRQAEITLNQDRLALHAQIRQQFYTVLVDQERLTVLSRMYDLVKKSYETGVARQNAGDLGNADVLSFLLDLQHAEASLRSAKAIHDGDVKQLEAIVGVPGLIQEPLQGSLKGAYPTFDEQQLIDHVTRRHTQVASALSVLRQNRILLRRAQVEPIPNPTLGPAYQFGLIPGYDQFWFNITFNIPVWDLNQGNIHSAKANIAVAAASVDTTRLNLVNQAANLLSQFLAAEAIVQRFEGKGKDGQPLWYRLGTPVVAALRVEKVPEAVLAKLGALKDSRLPREEFVAALGKVLTPVEFEQYLPMVLARAAEPGIVDAALQAARLYQIMFANKTTDLATLVTAQRAAVQANSDYVDALQNLWSNATQLSGLLQQERFP